MNAVFMNPTNSRTADRHRLLLYILEKTNLKKMTNMLLY